MAAAEDVIFVEELSAKRRAVKKDAGLASSSSMLPAAVTDEREMLNIVIHQAGSSHSSGSNNDWWRSILNGGESRNNIPEQPKIPRVPRMLREIESNKKCYEPSLVCIGPYHHGKPEFESMEKRKVTMAQEYVKGVKIQVDDLKKVVMEVATDARKYYVEGSTEDFDDEAFAQMMFLDGCFILQFMMSCDVEDKRKYMKMKSHEIAFVKQDLFLLENQIPFRVLQAMSSMFKKDDELQKRIKDFIKGKRAAPPQVGGWKQTIKNFFGWPKSSSTVVQQEQKKMTSENKSVPPSETTEPIHLLGFLRTQLIGESASSDTSKRASSVTSSDTSKSAPIVTSSNTSKSALPSSPSQPQPEKEKTKSKDDTIHPFKFVRITKLIRSAWSSNTSERNVDWHSYRSANELKAAGIHFMASESDHFTDVKYESFILFAVLKLPPMTIDDSTKGMLLNLVAYEASPNTPDDLGVTSYLCFMDSLIDHAEDVKELRSKGILLNLLGSDDQVAELFNDIATDLVPNPATYIKVKRCIEEHYKNKIKIWMAESFHTHFSSPWTILAFIGAIFALALSVVQTYYAINPP